MCAYIPSTLNPWALRLLGKTQTVQVEETRTYPNGKKVTSTRQEKELVATMKILESHGGPEDSWSLHEWTLPNGKVYTEYVQCWAHSDYSKYATPVIALKTRWVFRGKERWRTVWMSRWSRRQLAELKV